MKEPRAHLKANGIFSITHYQRNANQSHSQVPSHTGQEGCYQKVYNSKCWGGCGEKGTLLTLLVGMQTSTAAVENSVEIP